MGLFKRAKETYAQSEKRRANTLVNAEYIGGYSNKKKNTGNLLINDQKIEFKVVFNPRASFTIPSSSIANISVEGRDEVTRRVTVTRLLAVGIFAFALKKKNHDKEAFITFILENGQEAIFHIKNKSPMDLKVLLAKTAEHVRQSGKA